MGSGYDIVEYPEWEGTCRDQPVQLPALPRHPTNLTLGIPGALAASGPCPFPGQPGHCPAPSGGRPCPEPEPPWPSSSHALAAVPVPEQRSELPLRRKLQTALRCPSFSMFGEKCGSGFASEIAFPSEHGLTCPSQC